MPARSSDPRPRATPRIAALFLICSALGSGCGALSIPKEQQLSDQYTRMVQQELIVLRDRVVTGYVEEIGEQILGAAGPQPFRYRFFVVEDDDINAFAAFGGLIVVHTGLILKCRNVSELSGVMAHEIGHAVHRHIAQNYNRRRSADIFHLAGVIAASMFGLGTVADAGGGLAKMAVLNTYSREAEAQADAFAARVLPLAGYDPDGLVTFFETVSREHDVRVPKILSSHPATQDRIQAARDRIAEQPPMPGLRTTDGGRFEIIHRRIQLLTGGADEFRYR